MGTLSKGLHETGSAYVGDSEVKKICLGSDKVWPPYDAEIEYLEVNNNGAYINTGKVLTSSTTMTLRYGINQLHNGSDIRLWGASYNSYNYAFITGSNTVRTRWGSSTSKELTVSKNDILTFTVDSSGYTNYNETKGTSVSDSKGSSFNSSIPFVVGGYYVDNSIVTGNNYVRLYSLKINNTLDLIPVRIGQVGYMYDKVSKRLFGNAGSGSFTLGPDL